MILEYKLPLCTRQGCPLKESWHQGFGATLKHPPGHSYSILFSWVFRHRSPCLPLISCSSHGKSIGHKGWPRENENDEWSLHSPSITISWYYPIMSSLLFILHIHLILVTHTHRIWCQDENLEDTKRPQDFFLQGSSTNSRKFFPNSIGLSQNQRQRQKTCTLAELCIF